MSRIGGRNTKPERQMAEILRAVGIDFAEQDRTLPGRPDFVLPQQRIVVLVDGDFWHGWQFETWKNKLTPKWKTKIAANIRRDRRNRAALRAAGWTVLRVWEHQLKRSPAQVRRRLRATLRRIEERSGLASGTQAVTAGG